MRFDFEVEGDVLVSRKILRFGDRAVNASPAFRQIADDMMDWERELFDAQGGGQWRPIKEATREAKARADLDPRVLHATLALRESLTERGDENQKLLITDDFLVFGSTLKQAAIHQRQGVRRPLGFSELQKRSAIRTLQRFIVTGRAI